MVDYINDLATLIESNELTIEQVILYLIVSGILSMVIMITYRNTYQTAVYNRSFSITLPIVSMVTSLIVLAVQDNLALSLGMVGALSIIRFRTALKNPFDTGFMFLAVGIGITVGARLILHALIATFLIAFILHMLVMLEVFTATYYIIIRCNDAKKEEELVEEMNSSFKVSSIRNRTYVGNKLDITFEVRGKEVPATLATQIKQIEGITSLVILSHKGDYISE